LEKRKYKRESTPFAKGALSLFVFANMFTHVPKTLERQKKVVSHSE
jgi:hypothetical protein